MKPNLIQNYISTPVAPPKQDPKDFDIRAELANKTFIKPLPGRGKLVKSNIFDAPGMMVKDLIYDAKSLKHGIDGHANDHELGKLNDVGMKLGGLAIALYLFTRRQTNLTKAMEFVGPATFFASMALWPKIAIQLPALLIHGVNVQRNYEDSFGRKKPLYQDPQFIPWDLYTDKQIEKIGDRMNVPKDMPNRREHIQEKMKKIAVQSNTLWMLTAGFATPVMSALMCNALEKPILKQQNKWQQNYAKKLLDNRPEYAKKFKTKQTINSIENLIKLYEDKPLTKDVFNEFSKHMTKGLDAMLAQGVKEDMAKMLLQENYSIGRSNVIDMVKNAEDFLLANKFEPEVIQKILPTETEIIKLLQEDKHLDKATDGETVKQVYTKVSNLFKQKIVEYNNSDPKPSKIIDLQSKKVKAIYTDIVSNSLRSTSSNVLDKKIIASLRNMAKFWTDFKANKAVLDKYLYIQLAAAPETGFANSFNDITETIFKSLNFTEKEMKLARYNPDAFSKVMREKLEFVCADETRYKNMITDVCSKMAQMPKTDDGKYLEHVNSLYTDSANFLKENGFSETVKKLMGLSNKEGGYFHQGSLYQIQRDFIQFRKGNISTFQRFIALSDLMRRYVTGVNIDTIKNLPKELQEEHVEHTIKALMSGHAADFYTKLPMKRNPNPNPAMGALTVENGRIKYEFHNPNATGLREITDNGGVFYKRSMTVSFIEDNHPITQKILEDFSLADGMKTYRKSFIEKIANLPYFAKFSHMMENLHYAHSVDKVNDLLWASSNEENFQLIGKAVDELMTEHGRQAFNSKKWLNMFGKFGIALFGVTVLLQFAFGRIKIKQPTNTGVDKNA